MEDLDKYPRLKIAFEGIFQLVSCVYNASFWHVKLHKSTNFHAVIIFCTIVTNSFTGP